MKNRKSRLFCIKLLCLTIVVLMFNGCGNLVQGKPAADEEIAEFHIHLSIIIIQTLD
jgi:hypothetical protein